ncbi:DUF2489 domain-containing protein [Vibrio sp. S4M6]|uniref:DUF2489 domain-containing protein n=1 Tax=Vibrio sinus TaxID=2946865 RepID=UPI00202A2586|nr:DUF2489 domain-containing protein [Vibrio sinus]MCL9782889.1 DUF2489 domain-containing protein [Vibrio sinus]
MNVTLLATVGGLIILGLAIYAGYLLLLLKKQNQLKAKHQQLAINKRNANIYDNVNTLCMAGIQGQCDLSEISIRVYNIMDYVQGDERVDFAREYPATSELYEIVKDMPRGEERQKLAKKDRMKQNLARSKAEARLNDAIVSELTRLKNRVKPLNDQITIQMV